MRILTPPHLEWRPDVPTLGITATTAYQGMLGVRDQLLAELLLWLERANLEARGGWFLRIHTIDVNGSVSLEVGIDNISHAGDARVRAGVLPAGWYASMVYRNHGLRAARALLRWADDKQLTLDWDPREGGDRFGCRYEAYLTGPRPQGPASRWNVELSIRLRGIVAPWRLPQTIALYGSSPP
jgi:hypothetical protein